MTEAEWLACEDACEMLYELPAATPRKLRLFTVACCRCCEQLLLDPNRRAAVALAEGYADGQTGAQELAVAHESARRLARAACDQSSIGHETRLGAEAAVASATRLDRGAIDAAWHVCKALPQGDGKMAALLRDVLGNPFRPVNPAWFAPTFASSIPTLLRLARRQFVPGWATSDAVALARQMYEGREFSAMPILADALQDAGCDNDDILNHCRGPGPHVRGCWVVDLVLGKD